MSTNHLWEHPKELAKILEGGAVAERLEPDRLVGPYTTMAGAQAVVTAESGVLRLNGTQMVCRQLNILNAAVYIVNELVPLRCQGPTRTSAAIRSLLRVDGSV